MGDLFNDSMKEAVNNDNSADYSQETLGNIRNDGDFVNKTNTELLTFIQNSIRKENKFKRALTNLEKLYDDQLLTKRTELMKQEDIKALGTKGERELAVENELKNYVDKDLAKNIKRTKKDLENCQNENRLAEKIYKLKNMI